MIEASANLLQAAEENHVGAIVNMSQISARRDAVSNAARQHWVAERLLDHFSGGVTHLRPTFFAEWLTTFRDEATGYFHLPFADARHAPIAAEDQVRLIAAILADPAPHAGKIYPLYGPGTRALTVEEFVERNRRVFDGHPSRRRTAGTP